jgi:hypothetical protein
VGLQICNVLTITDWVHLTPAVSFTDLGFVSLSKNTFVSGNVVDRLRVGDSKPSSDLP